QIARFAGAVEELAAAGIRPPHVHLANSAAVLAEPAAHFTMVRPGLMLYGYPPASHLASRARPRPAMRLRTRIPPGRAVSAGTARRLGGPLDRRAWIPARHLAAGLRRRLPARGVESRPHAGRRPARPGGRARVHGSRHARCHRGPGATGR